MKKIIFLIIFIGLSFTFSFKILAHDEVTLEAETETEAEPMLPQSESESKDRQVTQTISSPQFYAEDNTRSFIKGVGVGFAVGIIIGGAVVWFYKRKLS